MIKIRYTYTSPSFEVYSFREMIQFNSSLTVMMIAHVIHNCVCKTSNVSRGWKTN